MQLVNGREIRVEVAKGSPGKNSENVRQNRNYNDENKVFVSCSVYALLRFLALSWNTTDEMLRDAFSQCGKIEHYKVRAFFSFYFQILTDRQTGRSRGMGIVKFSTREEMNNAISTMNGSVRNSEWIESVDVGWAPDRGARVPGRAGIHGSAIAFEGERREERSEAESQHRV